MSLIHWSPPRIETTHAGDELITTRATFRNQREQIQYLRQVIDSFRSVSAIRARARDIVLNLYNCPPRNDVAYCLAIARWVQANIRYVRERPETFQNPTATVALAYGDCDDFTTLIGSMVESLDIDCHAVGLEWDAPPGSSVKRAFQHIYPEAHVGGRRVPMDVTLMRPVEQMTDPIRVAHESGKKVRVFVA